MTRKAFTLIEILVVMSIIGLIVLFLIPTAGRAREAARRVQCINNLRQHGIAWYLYLDDHNYCFPPGNLLPNSGGASNLTFGGKDGSFYNPSFYGAQYRALNRYLDISSDTSPATQVFHCPDDVYPIAIFGESKTVFDYYGNSYRSNSQITTYIPAGGQRPRPFSSILRIPIDKIWLETCNDANRPGHRATSNYWLVMTLFVDGHAAGPFRWNNAFDNNSDFEKPTTIIEPNKKVLTDLNEIAGDNL